MRYTYAHYRDAVEALVYIDNVKKELSTLLYSKTAFMYSGIHVPSRALEHATDCISEVIDDLYYIEIKQAKELVESWTGEE